jgi:hypothetical protein
MLVKPEDFTSTIIALAETKHESSRFAVAALARELTIGFEGAPFH